jgi:light-harvesting complex II chlorophyll a/b binding protein 5
MYDHQAFSDAVEICADAKIEVNMQRSLCASVGPDRVLFLPSGLYDRSEVPDYLNGELAGE